MRWTTASIVRSVVIPRSSPPGRALAVPFWPRRARLSRSSVTAVDDVEVAMRSSAGDPEWGFGPVRVGRHECDAWVAYYRHEWAALLRAAVGMVHAGFGMG